MKSVYYIAALTIVCCVGPTRGADGPIKIVALGDSITKGVRPGVTKEQTYSFLLQQALKKEGIDAELVNVGIGGEDTRNALKRLQKAVIDLKPHIVTIMYGANDSFVDKGKKESRLSPDEFDKNLRKIVADLRAANIKPILMATPRYGDKQGPDGLGEHPNVKLEAFVKVCCHVAQETKTPLADHWTHWTKKNSEGINVSDWTTDHCHPNLRGADEISQVMLPVVLKVIREKQ